MGGTCHTSAWGGCERTIGAEFLEDMGSLLRFSSKWLSERSLLS